jgi:hypothetical protein
MGKTETEEKYQTTNSMTQISSWDAKFSQLVRIFLAIWGKWSCVIVRLVPILSQINPVNAHIPFLEDSFLLSMSTLSKLSLALISQHQNSVCPFPLSHTCHEPQHKSTRCPNVSEMKMLCLSVRLFLFWN